MIAGYLVQNSTCLRKCAAFFLLCSGTATAGIIPHLTETDGFRIPAGFDVTVFADNDLAHDIYKMTLDHQGRVVVSGRNYLKILEDTDGDGRADRATLFSNFPEEGARGMYFGKEAVVVTGDQAVWRLYDRDDDGRADGREAWLRHAGRGDHNANSLLKGPDGWYYLITGDDAGINPSHATLPGSPVKEPVQGAVLRISPDGVHSEIYAHGFRNPYDMAFNAYGHIFTYDADGERVEYLPWYVPCRVYDIGQGLLHGWIYFGLNYWNPPAYFFDHTERLADTYRGSPTGVVVYRHNRFPERYRNGLFLADWSYGRIYFLPLTRKGAGYQSTPEIFLQAAGNQGFAITAMEVSPEGDLLVSIGGRSTRGGVYRIRYTGELPPEAQWTSPLRRVLAAHQPLSSWSRAQWVPEAQKLGRQPFTDAVRQNSLPLLERIRAMEVLVELFGGIDADFVATLEPEPELMTRAAWALSRSPDTARSREVLSRMTYHEDARVARSAWEALGALPSVLQPGEPSPAWLGGFNHPDRRVRAATCLAAKGQARPNFVGTVRPERLQTPRHWLGYLYSHGPDRDAPAWKETYFREGLRVFQNAHDRQTRLDALRLLQIGLGDIKLVPRQPGVEDGYVGAAAEKVNSGLRREIAEALAAYFPTDDNATDREIARVTAMLEMNPPGFLPALAAQWSDESAVEDDIHYLLAATRLSGGRDAEVRTRMARALVNLQVKLIRANNEPSRFWPGRIRAMVEQLLLRDPPLAQAVIDQPAFALSEHALLAETMPEPGRSAAARRLVEAALDREQRNQQALTPRLVSLTATLPDEEVLPLLRRHFNDPNLQNSIIAVLADKADPADRHRFVETLSSMQPGLVLHAAQALAKMPERGSCGEIRKAVQALHRSSLAAVAPALPTALARLLNHWTDADIPPLDQGTDARALAAAWGGWFKAACPQEASGAGMIAEDGAELEARLKQIDWNSGIGGRGARIFAERGCQVCHTGTARLGPTLDNVTRRFSPDDLFKVVNDPEQIRGFSFPATEIVTRSGDIFVGILIYDSPAVRMMQTRDGGTMHFSGEEIAEVRESRQSLMPSGLLAGLSDQELADLYAFLRELGGTE